MNKKAEGEMHKAEGRKQQGKKMQKRLRRRRVKLPLVRSKHPGTLRLTNVDVENYLAVSFEPRIRDVQVTDETITAFLADGQGISGLLAWSCRPSDATPEQRSHWQIIGDGHGVHRPDIDEDLSADGMLHGIPARRRGGTKPLR